MNATSALVLIVILSFAADRLAKAILFMLVLVPRIGPWFQPPEFLREKEAKIHRKNRLLMFYVGLVAAITIPVLYFFPDLHVIRLLQGPQTNVVIDIAVTTIVVMGGSDLLGRMLQISGMGNDANLQGGAGAAAAKHEPIEVSGRLVLEQPDTGFSTASKGPSINST